MSTQIICYLCRNPVHSSSIEFCTACEHVFCPTCYQVCLDDDFCCHDDDNWKTITCDMCSTKRCSHYLEDEEEIEEFRELVVCRSCNEACICMLCKLEGFEEGFYCKECTRKRICWKCKKYFPSGTTNECDFEENFHETRPLCSECAITCVNSSRCGTLSRCDECEYEQHQRNLRYEDLVDGCDHCGGDICGGCSKDPSIFSQSKKLCFRCHVPLLKDLCAAAINNPPTQQKKVYHLIESSDSDNLELIDLDALADSN